MSSSRSDVVTKFVRLSARPLFFSLMFLESAVWKVSGKCLEDVSKVFRRCGSFKGVSRKFQGCFKEVSRVFQERFKDVSRKFQRCFREVSWMFYESFKGV